MDMNIDMHNARAIKRRLESWRENTHKDKTVLMAKFGITLSWVLPYNLEETGFDHYFKFGLMHVNETSDPYHDNWVRYRPHDEEKIGNHPGLDIKRPICHIDADYSTTIEPISEYKCCFRGIDYSQFLSSQICQS